jgi:hypothetical protein
MQKSTDKVVDETKGDKQCLRTESGRSAIFRPMWYVQSTFKRQSLLEFNR